MKLAELREPFIIPEWVGNASKQLTKMSDGLYPTVYPRGKVPALFKKDLNRAVEKVQIRLRPTEAHRKSRKRKRMPDKIPAVKQKKQEKQKSILSGNLTKQTKKRGRPKKHVTFQTEMSEQSAEEADAAQPTRTRSGRAVKRPRRE
jgi:hypothetical protein